MDYSPGHKENNTNMAAFAARFRPYGWEEEEVENFFPDRGNI